MIKNIIFDVDGTIWNSTEVVASAWRQVVQETGITDEYITADRLKKEFGKPMDDIFKSLFPRLEELGSKDQINDMINEYEHSFLEKNETDLTYPGMTETMKSLAENYSLFIVSNCQQGYIELVMRKTGIRDYISDWECFGVTGLPKSGSIRLVMDRNNLSDDETVYVGDIMGDFLATKEAGLKFIHAAFGFGEVDNPDGVINSYAELDQVLKNL